MQRAVLGILVDANRPGGAMTCYRLLLVARDFAVREAGEIIVSLVVILDVLETEQKELAFRIASHRSAMRAFFVAAVPLASWRRLLRLLLSPAARTDTVEVFGIKSHDGANYGAADR